MIIIDITDSEDEYYITDFTINGGVTEITMTGEDLSSAISLFINTKREMEEDNDRGTGS